jgi:hypothetical protein
MSFTAVNVYPTSNPEELSFPTHHDETLNIEVDAHYIADVRCDGSLLAH